MTLEKQWVVFLAPALGYLGGVYDWTNALNGNFTGGYSAIPTTKADAAMRFATLAGAERAAKFWGGAVEELPIDAPPIGSAL
jgi:hypothetical protein